MKIKDVCCCNKKSTTVKYMNNDEHYLNMHLWDHLYSFRSAKQNKMEHLDSSEL